VTDATPPPPPGPEAAPSPSSEVSPDLKDVAQKLTILLTGMVDLSARVGRLETAIGNSNANAGGNPIYVGPERRAPLASLSTEYVRTIHDETMRQTPKLDSMLPIVQSANTKQWVTIAIVIANSLATIAYALAHNAH
jgi:hypothetical protein